MSALISPSVLPLPEIEGERFRAALRAALRQVFEEHRVLFGIAFAYAAVTSMLLSPFDGALAEMLGRVPGMIVANSVMIASVAAFWTLIYLVRHRPARPFAAVWRAASDRSTAPTLVARALVLVPLIALLIACFSAIKDKIPFIQPFAYDALFIDLDLALHGGRQPWEILQPYLGHPAVTVVLDKLYYLWFPVFYQTFYWQLFTNRHRTLRLQFVLAFALCWILIGSMAALALSSAGPTFLDELRLGAEPFAGLFAYLEGIERSGQVLTSLLVQDVLWQVYATGADLPFEGISAMPSMHVAIAVLLALFGWRRHRLLGIAYTIFAVLIFLGSIHLGFHYAVDGYLAALMTVGIWWISGMLARRIRREDAAPSPSAA